MPGKDPLESGETRCYYIDEIKICAHAPVVEQRKKKFCTDYNDKGRYACENTSSHQDWITGPLYQWTPREP